MMLPTADQRAKVCFQVPGNKVHPSSKENECYAQLCREIFGIELPSPYQIGFQPVTITCWADQFALFLIRRHELKVQNAFSELHAKVIGYEPWDDLPAPKPKFYRDFDVTTGIHK